MKSIILLGGGGHCQSVLDTIHRLEYYDEIIILDEAGNVGKAISCHQIYGTDEELPLLYDKGYRDVFVTVGSVKSTLFRHKLSQMADKLGFTLVNLIDPSACISDEVRLGKGIFIGKKAIVNAGAKISDMSIINSGAIVEHNNAIGEYTHVSVGSVLCGDVSIGADCLIGANATVLQGIHIGNNCIIGAGSLIYKDIPSDSKIYGNALL